MRARLDDLAAIHDENAVGIDHRAEPVRDHECGAAMAVLFERLEVTCSVAPSRLLVASSKIKIGASFNQQRAGQRNPLRLTG